MLAASLLVVASLLAAPSERESWPPQTSLGELSAMMKAGNYHLIRQQKVAHLLEAEGTVEAVGKGPLLKLDENWQAFFTNIAADHGPKPGDRVKFRALIVDEAYSALQLWVYEWSKVAASDGDKQAAAALSEDTLQALLAKSKLCVSGTWTSVLAIETEQGVPHYVCEFDVEKIIAGECKKKTISVGFVRLEVKPEDKLPFLKEGSKSILFLVGPSGQRESLHGKRIPTYSLADNKLSIQAYREDLVRAVARIAETTPKTIGTAVGAASPAEKVAKSIRGPEPAPVTVDEIAGPWLLTMPRGFVCDASLERIEKSDRFRLITEAANLRGEYELREGRLRMVKPENERMTGLIWEIKNINVILLIEHPESSQLGSDYRNATLGRSRDGEKVRLEENHRENLRSPDFNPPKRPR